LTNIKPNFMEIVPFVNDASEFPDLSRRECIWKEFFQRSAVPGEKS
jgi:hypothetical protein